MSDKAHSVDLAAHTPSPWTVSGHQGDVVFSSNPRQPVAIALFDGRLMQDGEQLANARLIAAAPELLAAAETALRVLDAYNGAPESAAAASLRAAISKAEGAHGG